MDLRSGTHEDAKHRLGTTVCADAELMCVCVCHLLAFLRTRISNGRNLVPQHILDP